MRIKMDKLLIRGATVVNGNGDKPYAADVAVIGGIITEIGRIPAAGGSFDTIVDASGLTLTPGFFDMHSHSDLLQIAHGDFFGFLLGLFQNLHRSYSTIMQHIQIVEQIELLKYHP